MNRRNRPLWRGERAATMGFVALAEDRVNYTVNWRKPRDSDYTMQGKAVQQNSDLDEAVIELASRAQRLGLALLEGQLSKICRLLSDLAEYNAHTNLVARADPRTVALDHVLDSLTLVPFISRRLKSDRASSLVDIGSGAGFPGMILAIALPDLNVTLVDSVEKKARFLAIEKDRLALANVQVVAGRAEEIAHQMQYRQSFDFATARAVGPLDVVAELAMPLIACGGALLLQKSGQQIEEESRRGERALPRLAGKIVSVEKIDPQVVDKDHAVIIVQKTGASKDDYPRSWKRIKANPLAGGR